MTKRKTKRKTATKYVAMRSDCGSIHQLETVGDALLRSTIADAQADAQDDWNECGDDGQTYVIMQIVSTGARKAYQWTDGCSLHDDEALED